MVTSTLIRALAHPWASWRRRVLSGRAERAQQAADWRSAAEAWERVATLSGDPAPAWVLLRLGVAWREAGSYGRAAEILARARSLYPDNINFATNLAQVATDAGDWNHALTAWRGVADEFGERAPVRVWTRAAEAAQRAGSVAVATELLAQGQQVHGDDDSLLRAMARLDEATGDFESSHEKWLELLSRPRAQRPVMAYRGGVLGFWRRGQTARARDLVVTGLEDHPADPVLLRLGAELALVEADWEAALRWWHGWLDAQRDVGEPEAVIPDGHAARDWHEGTWPHLARAVLRDPSLRRVRGDLAVQIARHVATRSASLALDFLQWVEVPETDEHLVDHWRARFRVDVGRRGPLGPVPDAVIRSIPGLGSVRVDPRTVRQAVAACVTPAASATVRIPRVSVRSGSPEAVALRTGRVVTRSGVDEWVAEASSREGWEELTDGAEVVDSVARAWADEFADMYAVDMGFSPGNLSDAVFLPLQQTLLALRPLRRLADCIADDSADPVLIEFASPSMTMFDPIDVASAWPLLLLVELHNRGVPAALLTEHSDTGASDVAQSLRLTVGPTLLVGRGVEGEPDRRPHGAAVYPAGIRAIERVTARIDDPLVYSSDAIVGSFAYDRTHLRKVDYQPVAAVLPPRDTFVDLEWAVTSEWSSRTADGTVPVVVGATEDVIADVHSLTRSMLGEFLTVMMTRARDEVRRRGLVEAHVADHLYAGSAIVAGAVREAGGRVILWPHSANPVHVAVRRPGSFDEVHAITSAGCDAWRSEHPDVVVRHAPDLMLPWAEAPAPVDPDEPLTVVVIGGKSTLGLTRFLPAPEHRALVRRTFSALEVLRKAGLITIGFKAKGGGGEGLAWLDEIVGDDARYEVIGSHPLRVEAPNLVFVSISMASSALLEGITRGIPAMVVRDFPVTDYTTIHDGSIPIRSLPQAIELLRCCTEPEGRAGLVRDQVRELANELGHAPRWLDAVAEHTQIAGHGEST